MAKKQPDSTDWKKLVEVYNQMVKGFRSSWTALRAMVVVHSHAGPELEVAKQRIKDLQKRITKIERGLKKRQMEGQAKDIEAMGLELRIFMELLQKIEASLTAADIKAFCEKTHDERDAEISELLRIYLAKDPLPEDDLDKIDLLATELCSNKAGNKKFLKNVYDVDKDLEQIFISPVPPSEYEGQIVNEFKQAVQRIQKIEEVDTLLETEVIRTMRDFKKELIEHLANPRILKAMAVYNVALNNKLIGIFEKETGDINSASELVNKVKTDLADMPSDQQKSVKAILDEIEEMHNNFAQKWEQSAYNLDLVVEAAKTRKAIAESMKRVKEIRDATPAPTPGFERKSIQVLINEVFRALLSMEDSGDAKCFISALNTDLAKMDPMEKSAFLVDIDAMGGERRLFESVQESIVLRYKILEEFRLAKNYLEREEIIELIGENLEMANHLNDELQAFLDKFDNLPPTALKVIDLMKIKSGLMRSIKRLKSVSRMAGYVVTSPSE